MQGNALMGHEAKWYPLSFLGIDHHLTAINVETVLNTWAVLLALFILTFIVRYFLSKKHSLTQHFILNTTHSLLELVEQSVGKVVTRYYLFIGSIFLYILGCNWISLIPGLEEPTKDLNTTLALGLAAFFYIHKEVIQSHGVKSFLKEYFLPFDIMFPFNIIAGLAMLPLKLLGEFATVISLSFRLFGNIYGGFIIFSIYKKALSGSIILNTLGAMLGINLLITCFFVVFEGFLQAFVFSILTLTNIAMAVKTEDEGII